MEKNLLEKIKLYSYKKFMFWLMDTKFYYNLLKYILPFIRFTVYYPRFNKFMYQKIYNQLKPGDIILCIDYKKLTTKLIPGDWSHVGVCVAVGEGQVEIVDMTHVGFRQTDFFTFAKESERIRVKRVNDPRWDNEYNEQFLENIWSQKDSEYNWSFRNKEGDEPRKNKPLNKNGDPIHKFNYCSQLVTEADTANILKVDWSDLAGLGVPYISPTGLDQGENLDTIIDSGIPDEKAH